MKQQGLMIRVSAAALAVVCLCPSGFSSRMAAQSRTTATDVNWPLHNLDLAVRVIPPWIKSTDRTSSR